MQYSNGTYQITIISWNSRQLQQNAGKVLLCHQGRDRRLGIALGNRLLKLGWREEMTQRLTALKLKRLIILFGKSGDLTFLPGSPLTAPYLQSWAHKPESRP